MDPKPGSKRKHQSLSIQEKVDMLKKLDLGVSVRKLCETYGIGFSTVYDIKKQRDKILKFYEDSDSKIQMSVRKTMKDGKSTEHDRRMMELFRKWRDDGIELTGNLIKDQAKMLHQEMKLEHRCDYSEGWLQRFKKRHGIVLQKNGEKRSANPEKDGEKEKKKGDDVDEFSLSINEGHLNDGQMCSGESAGETGLDGRCSPEKTPTTTEDEEDSNSTKSDPSKTKKDREGAIPSKCTNTAGGRASKQLIKRKCKLKGGNKDVTGEAHGQKQEEWVNKCNNEEAATPDCLYLHTDYEIFETFPKSNDDKSKEEENNEKVYCEDVENEEIGEEEKDKEENLTLDDLIELLGNLIKSLGPRTFVTEEELMNFYLMHEKLHQERSKRLEKLRIHELFKKMTKRLVSNGLRGSSENPVPSTSANPGNSTSAITRGDHLLQMSETQEETIN